MTAIKESIEISRRPEDVFAYIDDLARHGEWQESIVSSHVDTDGPTRLGSRATEVRRMGSREQEITNEVTEHDPPRTFAFRGIDGPVEPIGDGSSSRVPIELDFAGHGFGKLLAPLARSQARKQITSG